MIYTLPLALELYGCDVELRYQLDRLNQFFDLINNDQIPPSVHNTPHEETLDWRMNIELAELYHLRRRRHLDL
jgi:hypothetical protein